MNIYNTLKFHSKRAVIFTLFSLPAYAVNLASVALMVQLFDFRHLEFLTPTIIGDIIGVIFNLTTYDFYLRIMNRLHLLRDLKTANIKDESK